MTRVVCLAILFGFLSTVAAGRTVAAERPNIILCMADDQGWGDVGYNGNPTIKTPTLDEMSRQGLRFDRFYAAAPVCSPTRGSVLTGRHPNRFGCFSWGHTLRPQEVTVAEALHTAGYATGHFGKWHLGSCRQESPASPGNSGFDEWFSAPNFYENDPLFSHRGTVVQMQGESSIVTVEAALSFIREQTQQKTPFLAVIWFGSPHSPHVAHEDDLRLYSELPKREAHYAGEITGIDRAMGLLRKNLRELGIADDTLLWYTSDNGPQGPNANRPGSSGGLRGRKGSLWDGGVRVPTIIEWPAVVKQNRITEVPGNTVDIYPTLLDIVGVEVDKQPTLDGTSLLPLIQGQPFEREKPLGFWVHPTRGIPRRSHDLLAQLMKEQQEGAAAAVDVSQEGAIGRRHPADEFPGHAVWMAGAFKLHQIPQQANQAAGPFRYELYNLEADRAEEHDLAEEAPEKVEAMKDALRAWQASVVQSLNGEDYK